MLRRPRTGPVTLDIAGAAALVVGTVPLLLALSLGHGAHATTGAGWPWGSWQIPGLSGVAAAGLLAFVGSSPEGSRRLTDAARR